MGVAEAQLNREERGCRSRRGRCWSGSQRLACRSPARDRSQLSCCHRRQGDRSVFGYADTTEAEITVVTARFGPVFDRGLVAYLNHERDIRLLQYGLALGELEAAIAHESPNVAILGEAALASSSVPIRLRTVQASIGLVALLPGASELYGRQLLAFGITACVPQEAAWSDISAVVRFAAEGKQVFIPAAPNGQSRGHGLKGLTRREREVLQLVQAGRSNPEIANALQIGVETVRSHIQRTNRKLGVMRRNDLMTLGHADSL